MTKSATEYLKELGFDSGETKVYMAIVRLGESPASKIAKKADLPRTTAISILEKLVGQGVVSPHKYKNTTYYWAESPKLLAEKFLSKASLAEEFGELFSGIYRSESLFPLAEVKDTKSGIRSFIEKFISQLPKGEVIYTFDTPREGNYAKIYPEHIEKLFYAIKQKKGILTQTLVPNGSLADIPQTKLKNQPIVIRELPAGINFAGSTWIAGNTLVHFSGNPPFLVAISHEKIAQGMKGVFDFFWNKK